MGPEGNILVNSPISTFQQGLTHSAMITSLNISGSLQNFLNDAKFNVYELKCFSNRKAQV